MVANPAPATPIGRPVPQPATRTGVRTMLTSTVSICTTMVGLTMPVPCKVAPIAAIANWKPTVGRNQ